MKKQWIWISVLLVFLSVLSLAQADGAIPFLNTQEEKEPNGQFSFRNGVQWGMNLERVKTCEEGSFIERSQEEWSILYSMNQVEVSRYVADLVYMFRLDQLNMITYDFGNQTAVSSFSYLQGALTSVYGEMREEDAMTVVRLMDQIYPGYYSESLLNQVFGWTAFDGTMIYLYYYGENAYAILYASPELALPGSGVYAVNGL